MQEGNVSSYQDRVPLFPGGSCYPLSGDHGEKNSADERLDQLSVIFSVIGMPSEEDLSSVGKVRRPFLTAWLAELDCASTISLDLLFSRQMSTSKAYRRNLTRP